MVCRRGSANARGCVEAAADLADNDGEDGDESGLLEGSTARRRVSEVGEKAKGMFGLGAWLLYGCWSPECLVLGRRGHGSMGRMAWWVLEAD